MREQIQHRNGETEHHVQNVWIEPRRPRRERTETMSHIRERRFDFDPSCTEPRPVQPPVGSALVAEIEYVEDLRGVARHIVVEEEAQIEHEVSETEDYERH